MNSELAKLCNLLNFAFDCMNTAQIPSLTRLRGAKRHLFMLIITAHNFAESVCVLYMQGRSHSTFVLLRSICESLIKSRYLYCNPKLHHWELRLEAFVEKGKQLNGMKEFLASSNSNDAHLANLSIDDVEVSLNQLRYSKDYCERRFRKYQGLLNKKGEPIIGGTLNRAVYVDKHNSDVDAKSESLVYVYHLMYRQLSSDVHLDGRNFHNYLSIDEDGCEVLLSGNAEDVADASRLALWLYQQLIRQFFRVYRIPCVRDINIILGDS